jgi:sarcosine oxidase
MATVVIGAGAVGSAAAYQLAKRGEDVVLIEQFALGHDRGSSHGEARIIRHSYADPTSAMLMPAAYDSWRRLEAESGRCLVLRAGGISACARGEAYVENVTANLERIAIPHKRMTGADWNRGHDLFGLPHDSDVVYEPDAGVVLAERALAAMIEGAVSSGRCEVRASCAVEWIDFESSRPVVHLRDGAPRAADRLVIAAGSWIGRLVPAISALFRPTRQRVFYFGPQPAERYRLGSMPIWIWMGLENDDRYYGMPHVLGAGVKAARHGGPDCDPDVIDQRVSPEEIGAIRGALGRIVPALGRTEPSRIETCLYTMTSDEGFAVDFWPGRDDIVIASPCSGHGFKFSCLVGEAIADLLLAAGARREFAPWRRPELAACIARRQ